MNKELIYDIILFISLYLLQIVLFNHLVLFGVACPFAFIYFTIKMRMNMSTNLLILFSFLLGLLIDISSDTVGINCLASTVLAMIKRPIFFAYEPHDDKFKEVIPGITSVGFFTFLKYVLTLSFIYCFIVFVVEFFSFSNFKEEFLLIFSSTIFTTLIILGLDGILSIRRD